MRSLLAIATFLALMALVATVSGESHTAYVVIVHPNNGVTSLERQFLADAFLKKATSWPSGNVIRPVDLAPGSSARRQFSEEVLHRSIAEVKGYWQQRIFSGRDVPPPEFDTDEDVVAYVLRHDGAVGYVSNGAALRGTKTVVVR